MSAPVLESHHALVAARGAGRLSVALFRLFFWAPAVFAVGAWVLFAFFNGVSTWARNTPDELRPAPVPGVDPQLISWKPTADAFGRGASDVLPIAQMATIGAVTVGLLGVAGQRHHRRPSRVMAVARHVKHENDRAKRDLRKANTTLDKWGQKRAEKWGEHWSAQAQRGELPSAPSRIDRALIRRVDPPAAEALKGRKRNPKRKAAKARASTSDWDTEVARLTAEMEGRRLAGQARLDPSHGPLVAPDASPSPQMEAHRAQAAAVSADVQQFLGDLDRHDHEANRWVGYTPPPAPVPLSKESD
jgi:hypothetical protein